MPIIKSANKKLRQDKKRTLRNKRLESLFKKMVKDAKKNPSKENLQKAASITDKAAKKNIIHKNKAARIKSSLSKLVVQKVKLPHNTKVKKTKIKTIL